MGCRMSRLSGMMVCDIATTPPMIVMCVMFANGISTGKVDSRPDNFIRSIHSISASKEVRYAYMHSNAGKGGRRGVGPVEIFSQAGLPPSKRRRLGRNHIPSRLEVVCISSQQSVNFRLQHVLIMKNYRRLVAVGAGEGILGTWS